MPSNLVPVSAATRGILCELSNRTGRSTSEIISTAVEEYRLRLASQPIEPIKDIPGVDPAEIWEAAREADAGNLISHEEMFARLRKRK